MPWIGPVIGGVLGAMSSDGGTSTQTNSVPPEFSGLASQYAQRAQQVGDLPFQPYPYAQTADFNPLQYMGFDMGVGRALNSQLPQQSQQALSGVLGGNSNPYMGQTTNVGSNPYGGAQSSVGSNPYAGANPYLESTINNTLGDVTRQFNQNVVPTEIQRGLQSGSFGNSGNMERQDQNRYDLSKSLGNIASGMRMQDYTTQQGLAESDINRRLGAQQTDLARNSGVSEAGLNRGVGAQQTDLARNAGIYQQGQGNILSGLGLSPNIESLGYQPSQYIQGVGGTLQQQGQNYLNNFYDQFQQSQQWPFQTLKAMGAPFGQNIGSTQTMSQPGNPVAGLFGGAMLGNQVGKYFQTPTNPNQYGTPSGGLFQGQQLNNPSAYNP